MNANLTGVYIKAIPCPSVSTCPVINLTYFTETLQRNGGVCGVDIQQIPVDNVPTVLYVLPQLPDKGGKQAIEGPRGVVVSTTGLVFEVSGGCSICISILPEPGDVYKIPQLLIQNSAPVVVPALHAQSQSYFRMLNELLPRLYGIQTYLANFNRSVENMVVPTRSDFHVMNSLNEMAAWGLVPAVKRGAEYYGSFIHVKMKGYIEATERIVSPHPLTKDSAGLMKSMQNCSVSQLKSFKSPPSVVQCKPVDLPDKYILIMPAHNDTKRVLNGFSAMVDFMKMHFDTPVVIPEESSGCKFHDHVRLFQHAVGFIAWHGAAFANTVFIDEPGIVIQLLPPRYKNKAPPLALSDSLNKNMKSFNGKKNPVIQLVKLL